MLKPRLRFAPSPTGYLHIGGVRTALFNWLWARKTGGTFVLRIEDTDQERSTPENEAIILRDLSWLGMTWDEGPDVGGPSGPYRQMERLPLYHSFADKLIEQGNAYRCYCSKEELAHQRRSLLPGAQFRYPGTCRDHNHPPHPDRPFVVRLRAPDVGTVNYHDLVFGEVTTPNSTHQDMVLVREDGVPLYNFGCVVDDLTMGITLVARGSDHMINTPVQILLYQALGYEPPRFAHLPMMLSPAGARFSKREGAVAVGDYRNQGLTPDGLLSYLVRFGWSFGDEEIFSKADLVEKFDWDRCSKSDGKFDFKKLSAVAFEHLKSERLTPTEEYANGVTQFLEKAGFKGIDQAFLRKAVPLIRPRAQTFVEAASMLHYFCCDPPLMNEKDAKRFLTPEVAPLLRSFRNIVASSRVFTTAEMERSVGLWLAQENLTFKEVAQAARVALTGRSASPGLFEVMEVLGRERSLTRLDHGVDLAQRHL